MFRLEFADNVIEDNAIKAKVIAITSHKMIRALLTARIRTCLTLSILICLPAQAATDFNITLNANQYDPSHIDFTSAESSLLNYSTICINKKTSITEKKSNLPTKSRSKATQANDDGLSRKARESIHLLVTDKQLSQALTPINQLARDQRATDQFIIDGTTSTNDELYGGSALNELVRQGFKSWWKNNEGSQLHNLHNSAPESIRTGQVAGKVKYDWDYSVKVSHNDVKLKLEKAF